VVRQSTERKELKEPFSFYEMVQEPQILTSDNIKLQRQQKFETRLELASLERVKSLINDHKFARTEGERKQTEVVLKQHAQEFYKQDPTLKSIRDIDMDITQQIRAILFEESKSKQNNKNHKR
jgi:hypothetical protein